jgi:hypothetical protein
VPTAAALCCCHLLLLLRQVRRDASKALSEFKRTHEEDALEQLRGMLGEEQWEALSQVTSSASYFV